MTRDEQHLLCFDKFDALRSDVDKGLADIVEGRVKILDVDRIIALGREVLVRAQSA